MRIKFLTSISGTRFSHNAGTEIDWKDEVEAKRFFAAGIAVPVRSSGSEKADAPAGTEQAVTRGIVQDELGRLLKGGGLDEHLSTRFGIQPVAAQKGPAKDHGKDKGKQ